MPVDRAGPRRTTESGEQYGARRHDALSPAIRAGGAGWTAPGDCVYLFTDGVTEAADPHDELFSEQRLEAVLRADAGVSAADIVKSVAQAVRDFVGTALPSDDITMLAVRRLAPAAA